MSALVPQSREQWQPGDLAECIHSGRWFEHGLVSHDNGPVQGEVAKVAFVTAERDLLTGKFVHVLRLERFGSGLFPARAFRKVVPQPDPPQAASLGFRCALRLLGRGGHDQESPL